MSSKYKHVRNGNGTCLTFNDDNYISFGKNGNDVMLRYNGVVFAFNTFEDMFQALSPDRTSYKSIDEDSSVEYYKIIVAKGSKADAEDELSYNIAETIYIRGIRKPNTTDVEYFLQKQLNYLANYFIASIDTVTASEINPNLLSTLENSPIFGYDDPNTFPDGAGVVAYNEYDNNFV